MKEMFGVSVRRCYNWSNFDVYRSHRYQWPFKGPVSVYAEFTTILATVDHKIVSCETKLAHSVCKCLYFIGGKFDMTAPSFQ